MSSIKVPDTISKLSPDDLYPVVEGVDVGGFPELQAKVTEHETKITANVDDIKALEPVGKTFTFVGKTTPTYTDAPHGNYVVSIRALQNSIDVYGPKHDNLLDGTIFTIHNEDFTDTIKLRPGDSAYTFEYASMINMLPETFATYVYRSDKKVFVQLESGYLPTSKVNLGSTIKSQIEADGYIRSFPVDGDNGTHSLGANAFEFEGATISQGSKPNIAKVTITGGGSGGTVISLKDKEDTEWSPVNNIYFPQAEFNQDGTWTKVTFPEVSTSNGITMIDKDGDTAPNITSATFNNMNITHDGNGNAVINQQTGIDVGAGGNTYNAVEKINFNNMNPTVDSQDGSLYLTPTASGSIDVEDLDTPNSFIDAANLKFHHTNITADPNDQDALIMTPYIKIGGHHTNNITLDDNFVFKDDGSNNGTLEIKHGAFEKGQAPGFFSYLKNNEFVRTNNPDYTDDENYKYKAGIFPTELSVTPNAFLDIDMAKKELQLQEVDMLDPNVTGGTDFLIIFRAAMVGKAMTSGRISTVVIDNTTNKPLLDISGNPFIFSKWVDVGDDLGVMHSLGIANFKGVRGITFHVNTSWDLQEFPLELGNRTNGGTCVMAQALTSTSRTGEALQQYELDTNQSVVFDTYHLGKDHYNIHTAIDDRDPLDIALSADQHLELPDGAFVYSKDGNLITTTNNVLEISGIPNVNSDFALVKTFSADETLAMKGKDINVTMNISNPTVGVDLYLAIWEGDPNEYTYDFIKGRNQNGSPMTAANWVIKDILYHDSKPDNAYYNINKTFTIPRGVSDTNYAIVVVPSSEVYSDSIKIKDLQVDVAEPFNTYYIHGIKDKNESHLIYDPGYVRFWLANLYYAGFRYTMDSKETPFPCGYVIRGKGPVVQDQTYNMVTGSVNHKGEGGMKFLEEGNANLNTKLLLWSEKDHNTTATFWWARVMPDGTFSEIPETRTVFNVEPGWKKVQCKMKEANVKVAADEILVLRGMSSELDGAFLESTDKSNPLVITDVIFTGLVSSSLYDDPELISSPMDEKLQVDRRVFEFSNNQSPNIVIDLNIEDDVELANYSAVHRYNNKVIPLTNAEFSYDSVLKKLTVHVGNNVTEGKIYLEFWG